MTNVLDRARFEKIRSTILEIPFVSNINNIELGDFLITGNIKIAFPELEAPLLFDFVITPEYPLKTHDSESITFFNLELIQYSHVMQNGNICIHTAHSENVEEKIWIDFHSLKDWIQKYFINKEKDLKYEHLVVNDLSLNGSRYSFTFTETDKEFVDGEIGIVKLSLLNDGKYKDEHIRNFYVKYFESVLKVNKNCSWNEFYLSQPTDLEGIYLFRDSPPATYNRFAKTIWTELDLPQQIIIMLYNFQQKCQQKHYGKVIPLFKVINFRVYYPINPRLALIINYDKNPKEKYILEKLDEKKINELNSFMFTNSDRFIFSQTTKLLEYYKTCL
ncbi:DUF4238 domain-containing protein [Chryseobacterium sp. C-71]|uniref:DUF4238 domain-containing protein n=1 Tax=Chryseobacterium sp. C-71 TaxID=2893882 RepID=UPI001E5BC04B|nr:DUF4238 domain-containing protein [Chryseobacterium sp. C-71]UFH31626.1 DUF4238 domain-containing protein [Chryseobacterium sp. C-71]